MSYLAAVYSVELQLIYKAVGRKENRCMFKRTKIMINFRQTKHLTNKNKKQQQTNELRTKTNILCIRLMRKKNV